MKTVQVKDIVQGNRALSAADGEKIFAIVDEAFEKNENAVIDFSEIKLTITAFLNASIGKLYSKYSSDEIRNLLEIRNLASDELELLKIVIDRAKERFSKRYPDDLDKIDIVNED